MRYADAEKADVAGADTESNAARGHPLRRATLAAVCTAIVLSACQLSPSPFPYQSIVDAAQESVVRISVRRSDGTAGLASGFYVNVQGTVATAEHVVQDEQGDFDAVLIVVTSPAIEHLPYRIYRHFPRLRTVLLIPADITPRVSVPVRFALSFAKGEPVMALGWPRNELGDTTGVATQGIVASVDGSGLLLLDMRTAPGASGAPVFNRNVEVIGIMDQVGLEGDPFAYAVALAGQAF